MAKVKITGHASGSGVITVTAPNTSTDRTITLPDATATIATTTDVAARLPSITDGGNATAITIDSSETVTLNALGGNSYSDAASKVLKTAGTQHTILSVETSSTGGHNAALELESNGNPVVIGTSGDDKMFFQTNAATGMVIDNTGAVTKPLQPAFLAQIGSTQSNISINGEVTILFSTEIFDQNADFNTGNYTFTAPVTGKYQFNVHMRLDNMDTSAHYYHMYFKTSNRIYYAIIDALFTADPQYYTMQLSVLADMDANDTAIVRIYAAGGNSQMDIAAGADSHFSGYLVC